MNFFKTLNEQITKVIKTQFFTFIIWCIVFLLIGDNIKAQRNLGTLDRNGSTTLNITEGTLDTNEGSLDIGGFPGIPPSSELTVLPKIDLEVTDVTLESFHYNAGGSAIPDEYKVWYELSADMSDIDLTDIEKFSFHLCGGGASQLGTTSIEESWSASIIDGIQLCDGVDTVIVTPNVILGTLPDVVLCDLVEILILPGSIPDPDCMLRSGAMVQIVVDGSGLGQSGTNASYTSKDCYDYYINYPVQAEIKEAEVLVQSSQDIIPFADDTCEGNFHVPSCIPNNLSADNIYDINLMLSNFTSSSIDVDVYIRTANPDATQWTGIVDISFNDQDLQNPLFTSAENSEANLSVANNIASLSFDITDTLTSEEQVFLGKLKFNYIQTANVIPTATKTIAASTFTVQNTTDVSYFIDADGLLPGLIDSYDIEDMLYEQTSILDDSVEPEFGPDLTVELDPDELGLGKTGNEEITQNNIELSPNPAKDNLHIKIQDFIEVADLRIFDVSGKKVYKNTIFESAVYLNVSDFHSGLYLMIIQTAGKHYKAKLLIQN